MYQNNVSRGEIYWIAPSEWERGGENTIRTNRPAIIVSNDDINKGNYTFAVVFLTTKPKRDEMTHITIRSSSRTSTALCEQITTVSAEQLGKYVGTCTDDEMEAVDRACMIALGIEETPSMTSGYIVQESEPDDSYDILVPEAEQRIIELKEELIFEKARAAVMTKMYNELLEKTLER